MEKQKPEIMKHDNERPDGWPGPLIPCLILAGFCFLVALMTEMNWTPFW